MTLPPRRLSWEAARSQALASGRSHILPVTSAPLADCVGRVIARDLVSVDPIPHYDSAAMDGWAVRGAGPWTLGPTGGHRPDLDEGTSEAIVTGAPIPRGTTAVLRSESGAVRDGVLTSCHPDEPRDGQHIRRSGREAVVGEVLIEAGTELNPAHLALAASAGVDGLMIHPVPRIDILLTGDEVATSGRPSPGRVRDGFGVQLPGLLGMLGGAAGPVRRVPDDREATIAALSSSDAPVVITTGGTGGSSADHLRGALHALGARLAIDGVAMRPGGPTCLAELRDGRLVLALPGNPLAAMVAAITLGGPLLAGLSGRPVPAPEIVRAPEMPGRPGTTIVTPHRLRDGIAVPTGWDGSAMMRGLASAHGLLIVPEEGVAAAGYARSVPLPWS